MIKRSACAAALAALAYAAPLFAHHSISMFDISVPVWLKGTVVRYEPINPHVLITLDAPGADGQVQQWTVEGPIVARLQRMNLAPSFLKPGDVIEVCGFAYKQQFSTNGRPPPAGGTWPNVVHGHMLVMPDGQRRPWGPYGKIENCVRPGDQAQTWLDFVDDNPMAREYWCRSRGYVQVPSVASPQLLGDVDARMKEKCR
ncbi:MAG TPA: DUF6152 family protein [Gammaproteobacteria bacterium]|nr:DUF6152 family protein [Gammaproteobacteria bacterium]